MLTVVLDSSHLHKIWSSIPQNEYKQQMQTQNIILYKPATIKYILLTNVEAESPKLCSPGTE